MSTMKTDCWTAVRLALALGLFAALSAAQTAPPTVTVEQGDVFGEAVTFREIRFIRVSKTINVFKGIPFAEPPVGELRFQPPVAKKPWDGAYNATYFRDSCVQNPSQETFGLTLGEDCLNLNIYAPSSPPQEGAAVMVWIHGGGFSSGSGSLAPYNGLPLVAVSDVIIVTINYRLNIFGFLTTNDEALPGNLGLMDQVLAMTWVKKNIAAFGGNPDQITIFGESAGSASVGFHVLSEQSKDLFNQAILQSGTVFSPWANYYDPEFLRQQAFDTGKKLGCQEQDSYALLNCMRTKNAAELYAASSPDTFLDVVVVDGTFLTDTPENLYASGKYNHVPLLLGSNSEEGTLFLAASLLTNGYNISTSLPFVLTEEMFDQFVTQDIRYFFGGPENNQLLDVIKMRYVDWSKADYPDADYARTYVDYATDSQFACGNDRVARAHHAAGDTVFMYQMTHLANRSLNGPDWSGVGHAEDLVFVFGIAFMPEFALISTFIADQEKELAVKFMEFWTNFAKTGNPGLKTTGSQPESDEDFWPRFTVPELGYKVLKASLPTSRALKSDMCYFWNTYIRQLGTMIGELDVVEREWRQSFYNWKYNDMAEWRDQFAEYKAMNVNIN